MGKWFSWVRVLGFSVCAIGLLSCGTGGGGGSDDGGLYAGDFRQIASGGIDDRLHSYPWGVEIFDGDGDDVPEIYVGTIGNALCIQAGVLELPPDKWMCPNNVWNGDDLAPYLLACLTPAVILCGTYQPATDDFTWQRVFEPPLQQVGGFRGAIVFNDALYMLSGSRNGTVYKTTDGTTWTAASPPIPHPMARFGGLRGATEFNGRMYVASDRVGEIWSSANPTANPADWAPANSRGFVASGAPTEEVVRVTGVIDTIVGNMITSEDIPLPFLSSLNDGWKVKMLTGAAAGQERTILAHVNRTITFLPVPPFAPMAAPMAGDTFQIYDSARPTNGPSWTLAAHDGYLYASAQSDLEGASVWRSMNPAPGNWEKVFDDGYFRPGISLFSQLQSYDGNLMMGTLSYPLSFGGASIEGEACEMLRLLPNDDVEVLVGFDRAPGVPGTNNGAPLSGIGPGFDQPSNLYVWRSHVHDDGWFYAGTADFVGILRDQAVDDPLEQFGLELLGPSGCDLWRTQNGVDWVRVFNQGLGDPDAYGIRNFVSTPWGLLVCIGNAVDGFELWLGEK